MKFISASSFVTPSYLAPSAWLQHIPFSFWLIEVLQPKLVVELGVHYGASYFAFCEAMKMNNVPGICYGIDTWRGDVHAGHYDETVYNATAHYNNEHYSGFSYLLKSTFEESLPFFKDQSIDLLHIDGFHEYESVKQDFEHWLPKMSDKGIILFHDICVREREFGVYRLWEELASQYPHFEFSFGFGLGVLGVGKTFPEPVQNLLSLNDSKQKHEVHDAYAGLGNGVLNNFKLAENAMRSKSLNTRHADVEYIKGANNANISETEAITGIERNQTADTAFSIDETASKYNLLQAEFNYIRERHDTLQEMMVEKQEIIRSLQEDRLKNELQQKEWEKMNLVVSGKENVIKTLQKDYLHLQQENHQAANDFRSTMDTLLLQLDKMRNDYRALVEVELQRKNSSDEELDQLKTKITAMEKICGQLRDSLAASELKYRNKSFMDVVKNKLNLPDKNDNGSH